MKNRYAVLAFFVILGVITFLDRVCIAVAGPRMMESLHLNEKQWGWVLSSFIISYSLFQIPLGALGDKRGYKFVLGAIVIWWSVFTSLTGVVSGIYILIGIRFLFGIGEAGAYPSMTGVISRWFPKNERGRAQGFIWGASRAGGALSPLIVVPVMAIYGWRSAFWLLGVLGILWGIAWLLWYKGEPVSIRAEKDSSSPVSETPHLQIPWASILRKRQFWLILWMYWFYVWGSWFYFSWLHTFLINGKGFSEKEMTMAAAAPFALGMLSNILGGFASDYLSKKYGLKIGRRLIGVVCLAISSVLLMAAGILDDKLWVAIMLALSFGVMDFMLPSAWALCLDVGRQFAGSISGAMNTAGNLGGFVCAFIFGYLVDWFGSYNAPLFVIGTMLMISSVLFAFINPEKPLVPDTQPFTYQDSDLQ